MMPPFKRLLFTLVFLLAAVSAHGQGATDHVQWKAGVEPTSIPAGGKGRLVLTASIGEGWKMYAMDSPAPSRGVKLEPAALPAGLTLGDFRQSEPHQGYDPNFEIDVRYFTETARIEAGIEVNDDAQPGTYGISGKVLFMICNDKMCLPPTRAPFEAVLTVNRAPEIAAEAPALEQASDTGSTVMVAPVTVDSSAAIPVANTDLTDTTPMSSSMAGGGGLLAFLLLAMGAGLAALLTPCVFPMIPLTVSYFTKHAGSRGESIRMALVYGGAIVTTFTSLGLLTALLVGAAGAQTIAANPYINLFIGAIFVVFALSLLGLFELRLPNRLVNYFNRTGNEKSGYLGVLFMGLTLTLVSFSCTAPFVGGLLAATAGGEWSYPILGMLVFSATFSLPFVFFALFPNAMSSLPRSGAWMNTVKVVLGFVELAAAVKFLSNADLVFGWQLISRPVAIAVVVVVFFLAGMYLIGKLRMKDEPPLEHVGVGRLLTSIFFFGVSLYMLPGLLGAPLNSLDAYLPPRQAGDFNLIQPVSTGGGGMLEAAWYTDDIDGAILAGRESGKPVFVDFSGYTCTNCREMEANVFTRPEVASVLQRDYVLLRLYTDDLSKGEEFQRYQLKTTGTVALPTYAVLEPKSNRVLAKHSGLASAEEFVGFLQNGLNAYGSKNMADLRR